MVPRFGTIEFKVSDGNSTSTAATESVAVSAVNDTPVVDLNGATAGGNKADTFTEVDGNDDGTAAVYLNGTGTGTLTAATNLTDLDNSTLASMTVSTAASSIKTGDVLVLEAAGGDVTLNL